MFLGQVMSKSRIKNIEYIVSAEYALGLLNEKQRLQYEFLMQENTNLAQWKEEWYRIIASLADLSPRVSPPGKQLLERIKQKSGI